MDEIIKKQIGISVIFEFMRKTSLDFEDAEELLTKEIVDFINADIKNLEIEGKTLDESVLQWMIERHYV